MIRWECETAEEAVEGAKNMIEGMQKQGRDFDQITFERKGDYIEVLIE